MGLNIYRLDTLELLGSCPLTMPRASYMVIRVLDDAGEYRRIKLVVTRDGLGVDDPRHANWLPGFRSVTGQEAEHRGPSDEAEHASLLRTAWMPVELLPQVPGSDAELTAKVMVRVLRKLHQVDLTLDGDLELPLGEEVAAVVAAPSMPEGQLLLIPAPGLPLAMERILERVDLGPAAPAVVLRFLAPAGAHLAAGTPLGRLEARSHGELPDGLREKVFLSHLISKVEEALAERT